MQKTSYTKTMETTVPFTRQQRITNTLLLNSSFTENIGLMHGKMGIAIYFFHLARENKNKIYEDYAGELIDEIYEEISIKTSLDFENGLAGIGWGIEYLVQQGFLHADTDEVLEPIENQLQSSRNQFEGIGLLNGITGLGEYYLKRLQNPHSSDEKATTHFSRQMLVLIIDDLELLLSNDEIIELLNSPETFDLTWDYPVLIAFLAEVYQLDVFNFQVNKILKLLIDPFFQSEDLPKLHSNRLFLALAFEKLKHCKFEESLGTSIEGLIKRLNAIINREVITDELALNSAFLINGTSGIAWVYKQLFCLTDDARYQKELIYWSGKSFEFEDTNTGFAGFNISEEKKETAFGLLEGLAGIALISVNTKILNSLHKQL